VSDDAERRRLERLHRELIDHGVLIAPTGLGCLSTAVTDAEIEYFLEVLLQCALDSIESLDRSIREEQTFRSVAADHFLHRVVGLLVQDAARQGCEIAVSQFGEGKISLEMAELVMGAVLAGIRVTLKGQKSLSPGERVARHLFSTGTIYLELRATEAEIQFRIVDDGATRADPSAGLENSAQIRKLRQHIAGGGGWFSQSVFEKQGSKIEFTVPLAQSRPQALVLRQGGFEALIPSANVAERIEAGGGELPRGALVLRLCESKGLVPGSANAPVRLRIGVADLQFWISCDSVSGSVKARTVPADGFVEEDSWLRSFGLFQEGGASRALPLLDGSALVRFHEILGGNP
jgi:hypothetical protein